MSKVNKNKNKNKTNSLKVETKPNTKSKTNKQKENKVQKWYGAPGIEMKVDCVDIFVNDNFLPYAKLLTTPKLISNNDLSEKSTWNKGFLSNGAGLSERDESDSDSDNDDEHVCCAACETGNHLEFTGSLPAMREAMLEYMAANGMSVDHLMEAMNEAIHDDDDDDNDTPKKRSKSNDGGKKDKNPTTSTDNHQQSSETRSKTDADRAAAEAKKRADAAQEAIDRRTRAREEKAAAEARKRAEAQQEAIDQRIREREDREKREKQKAEQLEAARNRAFHDALFKQGENVDFSDNMNHQHMHCSHPDHNHDHHEHHYHFDDDDDDEYDDYDDDDDNVHTFNLMDDNTNGGSRRWCADCNTYHPVSRNASDAREKRLQRQKEEKRKRIAERQKAYEARLAKREAKKEERRKQAALARKARKNQAVHKEPELVAPPPPINTIDVEAEPEKKERKILHCIKPGCKNPQIYSSEYGIELICVESANNEDHVAHVHESCFKRWEKNISRDESENILCPLSDCSHPVLKIILVRNKDNGERVVKSTEEIKLKDKAAELAAAKAKEERERKRKEEEQAELKRLAEEKAMQEREAEAERLRLVELEKQAAEERRLALEAEAKAKADAEQRERDSKLAKDVANNPTHYNTPWILRNAMSSEPVPMGKKKLRRAERVLQKQKEAASSTAVEKILPDELLPPAARAKDGDITGVLIDHGTGVSNNSNDDNNRVTASVPTDDEVQKHLALVEGDLKGTFIVKKDEDFAPVSRKKGKNKKNKKQQKQQNQNQKKSNSNQKSQPEKQNLDPDVAFAELKRALNEEGLTNVTNQQCLQALSLNRYDFEAALIEARRLALEEFIPDDAEDHDDHMEPVAPPAAASAQVSGSAQDLYAQLLQAQAKATETRTRTSNDTSQTDEKSVSPSSERQLLPSARDFIPQSVRVTPLQFTTPVSPLAAPGAVDAAPFVPPTHSNIWGGGAMLPASGDTLSSNMPVAHQGVPTLNMFGSSPPAASPPRWSPLVNQFAPFQPAVLSGDVVNQSDVIHQDTSSNTPQPDWNAPLETFQQHHDRTVEPKQQSNLLQTLQSSTTPDDTSASPPLTASTQSIDQQPQSLHDLLAASVNDEANDSAGETEARFTSCVEQVQQVLPVLPRDVIANAVRRDLQEFSDQGDWHRVALSLIMQQHLKDVFCSVCFTQPVSIKIVGCEHTVFCIDCLKNYVNVKKQNNQSPTCPVCENVIGKVFNIEYTLPDEKQNQIDRVVLLQTLNDTQRMRTASTLSDSGFSVKDCALALTRADGFVWGAVVSLLRNPPPYIRQSQKDRLSVLAKEITGTDLSSLQANVSPTTSQQPSQQQQQQQQPQQSSAQQPNDSQHDDLFTRHFDD